MKIINTLAFTVVIIFALVGASFLSILAHELTHKENMKKYAYEGNICAFAIPENYTLKDFFFLGDGKRPVGYYIANYVNYSKDKQEIKKLLKTDEIKATIVGAIIFIIFGIVICVEIKKRIDDMKIFEFFDYFNKWFEVNYGGEN